MKKIIIIGDIVMSKSLVGRLDIQNKLQKTLNQIDTKKSKMASPYTITLGDEFQSVYDKCDFVFRDIFKIISIIYPVTIRFVISIGDITTKINKKAALGMDGPAFYSARLMVETLKKNKSLFCVYNNETEHIEIINNYLEILSENVKKWSKLRWSILCSLMENITIEEIARKYKINIRSVYKNIEAGNLINIISFTKHVSSIINQSLEKLK
jgi:hypothetical protein